MTHLIIGLGNPPDYDGTRHNAGQFVISSFLNTTEVAGLARPVSAPGFKGEAYRLTLHGVDVILAPRLGTYMNSSGPAVQTLMNFFKVPLEGLIVVHDEVALPLGQLRISFDASPAGHNGVKSIATVLGSQSFVRVRLGVEAREGSRVPPTDDYILERFAQTEKKMVHEMTIKAGEALTSIITEGLEAGMNKFN